VCVCVCVFLYLYSPASLRELKYILSSVPLPRTVSLNATKLRGGRELQNLTVSRIVKKVRAFIYAESSLLCSQNPDTFNFPEQGKSRQHPLHLRYILILSSHSKPIISKQFLSLKEQN